MARKRKSEAAEEISPIVASPRKSRKVTPPRQLLSQYQQLSESEIQYLKKYIKTRDDPALICCPYMDRIETFVSAVNDGIVPNIPPRPHFINIGPLTQEYDSAFP
jgi:hypothetical protein